MPPEKLVRLKQIRKRMCSRHWGLLLFILLWREGMGEVEAAEKNELPELLQYEDLKGVFIITPLRQMAGIRSRKSLRSQINGDGSISALPIIPRPAFRQMDWMKNDCLSRLPRSKSSMKVANSGCIYFPVQRWIFYQAGDSDFEDEVLEQLDYVVASVHNGLSQDEDTMTERLIRAIEHPAVTMIGHLSGRLLLRREASKMKVQKIIDAALANKTILELNANPMRLDMDWRHWRRAAEKGLMCCINPDAHALHHFDYQLGWGTCCTEGVVD